MLVARDDEYAAVRARWAEFLTGPWSMREVPGDHVGMLQEPNVAVVAEAVQAEVDDLDDPATVVLAGEAGRGNAGTHRAA